MQLLVEWQDLDAFLFDRALLLGIPAVGLATVMFVSLCDADRHVEVSDFVGVLTRSRHFDRTCPVVVNVAQSVSKLLELNPRHCRLIEGHMEVRRQHTTLGRSRRHHKEIESASLV